MEHVVKKQKMTFEKCTLSFIEDHFGLRRLVNSSSLLDWLQADEFILQSSDKQTISEVIDESRLRINSWSEESLKMNFISPILKLAHYNTNTMGTFADEKLEVEFDNILLTGKADMLVAKGIHRPEIPYLFLHEYKKSRSESDPDGQLLAAMITAQKLNHLENDLLYGIVITGQLWNFVTLQNEFYDISNSYNCMNISELENIVKILKKTQKVIGEKIAK
jgi:hypothetical protein